MLIALSIIVGVLAIAGMRTIRARAARLEQRFATLSENNQRLAARDAVRAAFADSGRPLDRCLDAAVADLAGLDGLEGAAIVTRRMASARGVSAEALAQLAALSPHQRLSTAAAGALFTDRERVIALLLEHGGATVGVLALAGPAASYNTAIVDDARRALAAAIGDHLARCRAAGKSANRRTTSVMAVEELWRHRRSAARRSRRNAAARSQRVRRA